jgi:hypothetical protein
MMGHRFLPVVRVGSPRVIINGRLKVKCFVILLVFFLFVAIGQILHPAGLPWPQLIPKRVQNRLLVTCLKYYGLDLLGIENAAALELLHAREILHVEVPGDALPHILGVLDVLLQVYRELLQHHIAFLPIVGDYWYPVLQVARVGLHFVIHDDDVTELPIPKKDRQVLDVHTPLIDVEALLSAKDVVEILLTSEAREDQFGPLVRGCGEKNHFKVLLQRFQGFHQIGPQLNIDLNKILLLNLTK